MTKWLHRGLLLILLLAGGRGSAADWSQLKLGMTPQETFSILGEPLFRNSGQGFETWIYDQQAEVVFYGPLVGWTCPRTAGSSAISVDVWQASGTGLPLTPCVLPRPQKAPAPSSRRVTATKAKLPVYR